MIEEKLLIGHYEDLRNAGVSEERRKEKAVKRYNKSPTVKNHPRLLPVTVVDLAVALHRKHLFGDQESESPVEVVSKAVEPVKKTVIKKKTKKKKK